MSRTLARREAEQGAPRARRPRSLILRWVVAYALGFAVLIVAVLALVYVATVGTRESAADARIEDELQRLARALDGMNVGEMRALVTERSQRHGGRTTIYLLVSESRDYVAGNLPSWPRLADGGTAPADEGELHEFDVAGPDGVATRARGGAVALRSGHRLLVARNVGELRQLVGASLLGVLAITLLAGVGGGVLLSRRLSARLEELSRSSRAILAGDVGRRMPVSPRGDEFDAMATSLNEMLDRIDELMSGMRSVSESIAHDLRSPLSRLRSRIELALMQPPDASAQREVLESTVRDIDGVLAMFNALLTIATAESGTPRERFVAVELRALAAEAVETYEPAAEERGLRLTLDAPDPVEVRGEPHLLAQALANLLDNAVKYATPGAVVVRLRGDAGVVTLEVSDSGPGMPEDFRERAFERFSRVEQSRTTPGSGLGLSLVRAVARLHGGTVSLAGDGPGSTVRIELPRP